MHSTDYSVSVDGYSAGQQISQFTHVFQPTLRTVRNSQDALREKGADFRFTQDALRKHSGKKGLISGLLRAHSGDTHEKRA